MERSTLSFFSRFFSSKKKKILGRRDQEEFKNEGEINKIQRMDTLSQNLEETGNKRLQSSLEKETEDGIQAIIHESLPPIPDGSVHNVYTTHGSEEGLAHEYGKNTNEIVSTVRIPEKHIIQGIEVSKNVYEEKNVNQENPGLDANSIKESLDQDDSIEYDSMVLLSKLEQLIIKLSNNLVKKSTPLVIEVLVEMVNYVVEFTEQLPILERKKISLIELLDHDKKNYRMLNSDYVDNKRLTVERNTVINCIKPQEIFIDLSNDLLRIVNVYLSTSVKVFKSNRIKEQWKTLYTGFFVNLTKIVRSSQANQKNWELSNSS